MENGSRGVTFIGIGDKYINEALKSSRQLKNECNEELAIICDRKINKPNYVDHIVEGTNMGKGTRSKIENIKKSPFEKTVFLDTDVYVDGKVNSLFDLLEKVDLAVAKKPDYYRRKGNQIMNSVPKTFNEFNTGVIAFRNNEKVKNMFEEWGKYDQERFPHDQPSFKKAVYMNKDIRYHVLDERWNCRFTVPGVLAGKAKLFHGRPWKVRWNGQKDKIDLWSDEYIKKINKVKEKLNKTDRPRVHYMDFFGNVNVKEEKRYVYKVRSCMEGPKIKDYAVELISRRGLYGALRDAISKGAEGVWKCLVKQ